MDIFCVINKTLYPIDYIYCRGIISKIRTHNSVILDIGCGDGQKTKYVTNNGCVYVTGLDHSECTSNARTLHVGI